MPAYPYFNPAGYWPGMPQPGANPYNPFGLPQAGGYPAPVIPAFAAVPPVTARQPSLSDRMAELLADSETTIEDMRRYNSVMFSILELLEEDAKDRAGGS